MAKAAEVKVSTTMAVQDIHEGSNVRKGAASADLVESVKSLGILQPLLVRPVNGRFEVVCGHRRLAAAEAAGLDRVPVMVREMTDEEALAAQIVENDQREDAHPLDQAAGYKILIGKNGTVQDAAARVGRSVAHVYNLTRLLDMTKTAQKLFRDGEILLGHAIVLSRLSAADQERAIADDGALFTRETVLELDGGINGAALRGYRKSRTVRELQGWVDRHVRLSIQAPDLPQLFPATAAAVAEIEETKAKMVPITFDQYVQPEAKDDNVRTYGPQSFRRADGKLQSKTCSSSVLGVIVVGPGRGECLQVCIDRKRCAIHFGDEIKRAARTASLKGLGSATNTGADKPSKREAAERAKRAAEQAASQAKREQWRKASPEIYKAIADFSKTAKVKTSGAVADGIVDTLTSYSTPKPVLSLVKRGKTAEDLVRYLTFLLLCGEVSDYSAAEYAPKNLKAAGVDVTKILAKFPVSKSAPSVTEGEDGIDGDDD